MKKSNTPSNIIDRRDFLEKTMAAAAGAFLGLPGLSQASKNTDYRYKISVCDWMILQRQDLDAFPLADKIGVDGVEVDMGGLGDRKTFASELDDPATRKKFLESASKHDLEISSIAMSGFYAQSFAERPTYQRMLQDCIDTMTAMNVEVAFLPLGVQGDLVKHPELRPTIVKRLKKIAPRAEEAGVVIGLETALDAAGEVELLEDIGSPTIQSYFNFANALQNGRDLHKELRTLGKDRICQIHCTDEDGVLLENNSRIDMPKVKQTLDDMGWSGWLVLERSRNADNPHDIVGNFGVNAEYMKSIFQPG
ncbi:sugar phosphate isomerase/epimerase [Aliifodinibius sp. S!AR15-10]|uniref:sugar phosphate isomerase/epimerase family protein n=1 Tax=Aliifodinibius sp. S!AR15-10 TaxID=2950437 RepID=UPI002856AB20|nr:sugar phosphate isomerase/epimerase family protein [Aliifodinibius sp. S!AR15-10]MDR8391928.1 sugar phosphate isomerase/epimerase [Aliifodinibius sp. S!AR15-10]